MEKWSGLVEVIQEEGVTDFFGADCGAFITILALCKNEEDYKNVVTSDLIKYGLILIDAKEIVTCKEFLAKFYATDMYLQAVDLLNDDTPIVYMDFHSYPLGT